MNIYLEALVVLISIIAAAGLFAGYVIWASSRDTTAGAITALVPGAVLAAVGLYFLILGMMMGY